MHSHGPYHRTGTPGGPGCKLLMLPVRAKTTDGTLQDAIFLNPEGDAGEVELLRTIAARLGVKWGRDGLGWWACVPVKPSAGFAEAGRKSVCFTLWREDDNGARFLISRHEVREEAEARAAELTARGHKQHYFVEVAEL